MTIKSLDDLNKRLANCAAEMREASNHAALIASQLNNMVGIPLKVKVWVK